MTDTHTFCCWPKCEGKGIDRCSEGYAVKTSECRCFEAVWKSLERELIDLAKSVQPGAP
jgi:hypothetical protein